MQNLGEFFPEDVRGQWAANNLTVGAVLKLHITDISKPKPKILVVLGFDSQKVMVATVFINSEINPYLFKSPAAKKQHLELDPKDRGYLTHTSFVDCSSIREYSLADFNKTLTDSPGCHIGDLSPSDLETVTEKVRTSPTITPKLKKKYGLI